MGRPSKKNGMTTVQVEIPAPLLLPKNGNQANQLLGAALNRLRLAMAEIRIVRPKLGTGSERIANKGALQRTRLAYIQAAQAIGLVRRAAGLTEGEQQHDPSNVRVAREKLEEFRLAIGKLDVMEVDDD